MAITGLHTLIYSRDKEALKAVLRDAFELPVVAEDDGFVIFSLPPATLEPHAGPPEMDIHPSDGVSHELSFMCDDLESTVAELRAKGVTFRGDPIDMGWGTVIVVTLPGDAELVLYEPSDFSDT